MSLLIIEVAMTEFKGKFDNSKIMIVGGAGFVGSNLVKTLLAASQTTEIHIIDNLLSAEECNIPNDKRVLFTKGSITSDSILSRLADRYDYIFHLLTFRFPSIYSILHLENLSRLPFHLHPYFEFFQ